MQNLKERQKLIDLLKNEPIKIGRMVGFKDLTELHNKWLKDFLYKAEDQTKQGHRGSYKTTVLSLFFALNAGLFPKETLLYFRKTDSDVAEIARQTQNIMQSGVYHEVIKILWGHDFAFTKLSANEISTNLVESVKGASQIVGLGIGTSITGKHADIVVTDDIVNVSDRSSRAEREKTKRAYMEMQNIKNRGGRFINTGTPWHVDDCFTLMPNIERYDCYSTGLMTQEQIQHIRERMTASLFAANYELKHIADENAMFLNPQIGADIGTVLNGVAHVDSAFHGEDFTAFGVMAVHDGKYYVFGKMWRKHVEDCYKEIELYYKSMLCQKLYMETNADKGMVAKDFKRMGIKTVTYSEKMNKFLKISTYLKAIWKDVIFVDGTDEDYINQICDYTEDAEHDDAPDNLSCLARLMYKKPTDYSPIIY